MKVAIVSPYYKEKPEILKRCHDSVLAQTHADVMHVMISDGFPCDDIDQWKNVLHVRIPDLAGVGDTPRLIGCLIAANLGVDAICMLDADNWIEPDHVELLCKMQASTGAQVVTATRMLWRMDGTQMGVCNESNGNQFNDTNCYFLTQAAFPALSSWSFKDPKDDLVGDRIFWDTIKRMNYSRAHCMIPTVNYQTNFAFHYQVHGETPPAGTKIIVKIDGDRYFRSMLFSEYQAMMLQKQKQQQAPKLDLTKSLGS